MGEPYTGRAFSVCSVGLPVRASVANQSAFDPVSIQSVAGRFPNLQPALNGVGKYYPVGPNRV